MSAAMYKVEFFYRKMLENIILYSILWQAIMFLCLQKDPNLTQNMPKYRYCIVVNWTLLHFKKLCHFYWNFFWLQRASTTCIPDLCLFVKWQGTSGMEVFFQKVTKTLVKNHYFWAKFQVRVVNELYINVFAETQGKRRLLPLFNRMVNPISHTMIQTWKLENSRFYLRFSFFTKIFWVFIVWSVLNHALRISCFLLVSCLWKIALDKELNHIQNLFKILISLFDFQTNPHQTSQITLMNQWL